MKIGLKTRPLQKPMKSLLNGSRRGKQMEVDALTEIRKKTTKMMMRTMMRMKTKLISPKSTRPALKDGRPNSRHVLLS